MMRALLTVAGAWVIWRVVNENTRRPEPRPVALLPKPNHEPRPGRSRQRSDATSTG